MPLPSPSRVALAAAAVAVSVGAGAPTAGAAAVAPTGARITSPAANTLVASRYVSVRLRVGPKVTSVRVFAGTRDVSRRFSHHGRVWTASLLRRGLRPGRNKLVAQARVGKRFGEATTVSFLVARAAPGFLTVRSGAAATAAVRRAGGYAPATAELPVAIQTRTPAQAQLTVNGRRVFGVDDRVAAPGHSWLVSRRDGLRAGRNVLRVVAYDRDGRRASKRWTFVRSATRPFAEAGPHDRTARRGAWVRLDGSGSRGHGPLRYAWRVVQAPRGAQPRLRRATSATPLFKPRVAGVYRLALRTTGAGGSSQDVVTVNAAPVFGDQGLYVSTDLEHGTDPNNYASISYGGQWYAAANPTAVDLFLQIDPATLAVRTTGDHTQITPAAGTITIGVWNNATVPYSTDQHGSMVWIGNQLVGNSSSGKQDPPGNPDSNLHGWLSPVPSGGGSAKWFGSDYLQVQTRTQSTDMMQNTMLVNGRQTTVTLPAGAIAGFQAKAVDNTGNGLWDPSAYPITGDAAADAATENQLASDLKGEAGQGVTIMLQGFGHLPSIPGGSALAQEIDALGGRSDTAYLLNGTPDGNGGAYALIAGRQTSVNVSGWVAKEAASDRTGGGSLTALLSRDPQADDYVVMQSDDAVGNSAGAARYRYLPLIYSPPTPWSGTIRNADNTALQAATPAQQAALAWIADYAGSHDWTVSSSSGAQCPNAPDPIRASYCTTSAIDLENLENQLTSHLPAYAGQSGFSAADYAAAQTDYEEEVADVASVRADLAAYANLYSVQDKVQAIVDANSIGQQIEATKDLTLQTQGTTDSNELNVITASLQVISALPDVGSVASFMEGMVEMAQAFGNADQPTPSLANQVKLTEANAASTVAADYSGAANGILTMGNYLAEDPQKLLTGGYALAKGDLVLTTSRQTALTDAATYGMRQYLWGTILSTSYASFTALPTAGSNPECSYNGGTPAYPMKNVGPSGHWGWAAPDSNGTPVNWWIAMLQTSNPTQWAYSHSNIGLPVAVTDALFAPLDATKTPAQQVNVGAVQPYFSLDYLQFLPLRVVNPDKDPDPGTGCVVTKY